MYERKHYVIMYEEVHNVLIYDKIDTILTYDKIWNGYIMFSDKWVHYELVLYVFFMYHVFICTLAITIMGTL